MGLADCAVRGNPSRAARFRAASGLIRGIWLGFDAPVRLRTAGGPQAPPRIQRALSALEIGWRAALLFAPCHELTQFFLMIAVHLGRFEFCDDLLVDPVRTL